jgi:7,8-dihydropterin-6-yl-methyl-4-(beta-D-ribofuranosyl)aminobenzene 5'-phosphate synthase
MKLTIVYDNEVFKKGIGLKSGWGFSCLIEYTDVNILFDTGAKGKILLNNLQKLDINPKNIDKIVISHEHWDHNGGLESIMSFIDYAEVYRLSKNHTNEKTKLIIVNEPKMISDGIYSTGRLIGSPIDEQSLILKGKEGWYVLVGCSHPGVENILQEAKKFGAVVGLIGGFHGFNDFKVVKDLNLICPCHCTSQKKDLKKAFSNKSSDCGVGTTIDI